MTMPVRDETATSAATRYVEVDGDRIAYRRIGAGAPIVLANRMRGTIDTWDPLFLDALARHRTVVTFDYPGTGSSSGSLPDEIGKVAAFVDAFATALGLGRYAVLGWSWGGLAAQALLLDRPERVTHAVLVGTNPPGPTEFPTQQVFVERAAKPVNDLADEQALFFEPRSAFSCAAAAASRARIYARPGVAAGIPSTPDALRTYFTTGDAFRGDEPRRRERLMHTSVPVLVICGDHDTNTAGQNWFLLIGRMRNAQFVFYSEAGHAPQHQHPELTVDYIAAFLARAPSSHAAASAARQVHASTDSRPEPCICR